MSYDNLLFHWSSKMDDEIKNISWISDEMYKGRYVSPGNHQTLANNQTAGTGSSSKVTNGFMKALLRTAQVNAGLTSDGFGTNEKCAVAEFTNVGPYDMGVTQSPVGQQVSVIYTPPGNNASAASFSSSDTTVKTSAPYFMALIAYLLKDSAGEFCREYAGKFFSELTSPNPDIDVLRSSVCRLANIMYYYCKENGLDMSTAAQVKNITPRRIQTPDMVISCFSGTLSYFNSSRYNGGSSGNKNGVGRVMSTADFVGRYTFYEGELSEKDKKLVPTIDESYVVGQTLIDVCEHIKESTRLSRPIRNILLRGEPGTGKSEMYVGIAAGCNLPLRTFAANAMTEPYDLFGSFLPISDDGGTFGTSKKVSIEETVKGIPSMQEIVEDPEMSYFLISGKTKEKATTADCMAAIFECANKTLNNGGQQKFKYVPGQLVYALKYGGVWGFDEVTLPLNQGVVPALNPAMDNTQSITLPTGEIVKRHPNCIFVSTTNIDLEGCRRMNQAWQDRCQLIIDLKAPGDEELVARIKSMTDYDDMEDSNLKIEEFIMVYKQLKEIAAKRHLEDGVIGPRKLADWIISTRITGDPIKSARMTIVPGATADASGMDELMQKIEDAKFSI